MATLNLQSDTLALSQTYEPFLTVAEVAKVLRVSPDTASRRFANQPGVIDLGHAETRKKRLYRQLRIPLSVLNRFLTARRVRCN
jgi:hypothetical protein